MIRHIVLHPPQLLEEQVDVGCVDIYIHKFSQCDLFQLKVLAKETSILKDSVDKRYFFEGECGQKRYFFNQSIPV